MVQKAMEASQMQVVLKTVEGSQLQILMEELRDANYPGHSDLEEFEHRA